MKYKIRTFVAIELPEKIRLDIRKLQHVFSSYRFNIRWVKPLNMHLTITFLGDIDPSEIKAVSRTLSETAARYPVFELVPRGVGVFPSIRQARIIWTGVAGQTHVLRRVQASVEKALEPLGFAAGKHPYRGHLTLGRARGRIDQSRLAVALRNHKEFVSQAFSVKHLVMFKSERHPGGPIYVKLCEIPLLASK